MERWLELAWIATLILTICLGLFDTLRQRSLARLSLYVFISAICGIGAFVASDKKIAFGSSIAPELVLGIMFVCVIFGIAATYIFNLTSRFSWLDLLRPMVISPLVLLPLVGSIQGAQLEPIQT